MAWSQSILELKTLYMPDARPDDCHVVESLGFRRIAPEKFEWDIPGTREYLTTVFNPTTIHHVYKDAQGNPILWGCIAAVTSEECFCFGEQYAISIDGPCIFKPVKHIHVVREDEKPVPLTEEERAERAKHQLELREKALKGDARAQFTIDLIHFARSTQAIGNIESIKLMQRLHPNPDPAIQGLIDTLEETHNKKEEEYRKFQEDCIKK